MSHGFSGEDGNSRTRVDLCVIAISLAFPESLEVRIGRQLDANDPLAPLVSELVFGGQLERISVTGDQVCVVDTIGQQHVASEYRGKRQRGCVVISAMEDDGDR